MLGHMMHVQKKINDCKILVGKPEGKTIWKTCVQLIATY